MLDFFVTGLNVGLISRILNLFPPTLPSGIGLNSPIFFAPSCYRLLINMDSDRNLTKKKFFDELFNALQNSLSTGALSQVLELLGEINIISRLVFEIADDGEEPFGGKMRDFLIGTNRISTGPKAEGIRDGLAMSRSHAIAVQRKRRCEIPKRRY